MPEKDLICTSCPNGCKIHVSYEGDTFTELSGNQCPRGITFTKQELFDPRRIITSSVKTQQRELIVVPVRTTKAIPVKRITEAMQIIHDFTLNHAVAVGDVLLADFIEPGNQLIATRSCP